MQFPVKTIKKPQNKHFQSWNFLLSCGGLFHRGYGSLTAASESSALVCDGLRCNDSICPGKAVSMEQHRSVQPLVQVVHMKQLQPGPESATRSPCPQISLWKISFLILVEVTENKAHG